MGLWFSVIPEAKSGSTTESQPTTKILPLAGSAGSSKPASDCTRLLVRGYHFLAAPSLIRADAPVIRATLKGRAEARPSEAECFGASAPSFPSCQVLP
jgi:hypothetical protein